MKLAAIYNIWDGEELLIGSMRQLDGHVDLFILLYQDISNFGEKHNPLEILKDVYWTSFKSTVSIMKYDPVIDMGGMMNERAKRNLGIDIARQLECTHFISIDCDEYYHDFAEAKRLYIESGYKGSVCSLCTFFKKPIWRFDDIDGYFVPFIHELTHETKSGSSYYPFYVDPTRGINESNVIQLPVIMQHFSWVRKDIERKCRNSSARDNFRVGSMLSDYRSENVGPGFLVKDYDKKLVEVPDYFGLSGLF